MEKIRLNGTELQVSAMCLGTGQYGSGCPKEDAFRQMDIFTEAGGNFIDTALVYGDWGDEIASSEKAIGEWMKNRGSRNKVILSTKGCHPRLETMKLSRVTTECLQEDVELSLRNLQTDVIDLYFLHRDNLDVSAGELLEGLEEQVRKGNLRYYGCSNWSLARIKEAAEYAAQHTLKGFVCNQVMIGLPDIYGDLDDLVAMEDDMYQYHKEKQLNAMAYNCQAGGYFTKRLQNREVSASMSDRYDGLGNEAILQKLREYEREGYGANDFLLHYVPGMEFPAIPICGFRTEQQLKDAIRGISGEVPKEMLDALIALKQKQVYGKN